MEALIHILRDYLDTAGIQYMVIEGRPDLRLGYSLENVNVQCSFKVNEESRHVTFQCYSGIKAPPDRRDAVAEFVARANYGLTLGGWQYDLHDGEIFFQTSICARGVDAPSGLMAPLLQTALEVYNHYYPGLVDVIYRGLTPQAAIERLEGVCEDDGVRETVDPAHMAEVVRQLLDEDEPDAALTDAIQEAVDGADPRDAEAPNEESEASSPAEGPNPRGKGGV